MPSGTVTAVNTLDGDPPEDRIRCAECDAWIDRNEWHPVRAVTTDDDFRIHAFCSEACREAWSAPDQ